MNLSHSLTCSKSFIKGCVFLLLLMFNIQKTKGQCTTTVSTFPYRETFEVSPGNWIPGGTNSDWSWGTPIKSVISTAGEGNKSWITGGLTASSYNGAQNSTLESPCFDFSSLDYPQIRFKIFWETERRFDGATIQYSTNGGSSWSALGDVNSNSSCKGQNWYNTPSITYLGNTAGWSGNVQSNAGSCLGGSGSGSWLTASHTLSFLAGEPSVKFRFVFGSGTTCNDYNGYAIDDVVIEELPPNTAEISYLCLSSSSVAFFSTASCAISISWNFDDPASGAANISTLPNPGHVYASPGIYNVSMTATFASGPPVTKNIPVTILRLTTNIETAISCNGSADGSIRATATGGPGPFTYSWSSSPSQNNPVASNLPAGVYTINVNSPGACAISAQAELVAPAAIIIGTSITDAGCSLSNGSISAEISGGSSPYIFTWSTGANTQVIENLGPGFYSLSVTDSKGCSSTVSSLEIKNDPNPLALDLGPDRNICPGDEIRLNPGTFSSYLWQDNSTASTYRASAAGLYYVTVKDNRGCTATDSVHVTMDCSGIYFPTAFTPNGDYKNEHFGPFGSIGSISSYKISVYNRFGERIFYSTDPYKRWDGKLAGMKQHSGAFTWFSTFRYNGKSEFRKGIVILLR